MIGRPLGAPEWIAALERQLGRRLAPGKPGPKPRMDGDTKRQRNSQKKDCARMAVRGMAWGNKHDTLSGITAGPLLGGAPSPLGTAYFTRGLIPWSRS